MNVPLLGCIADDYTGATDLSSMLVRAGLRVIQCFGTPERLDQLSDADAVVISLKSRSIPAAEAVEMSLTGLRYLQSLGVKRYFFKYCSTFDSTPQGNIGPVADALAEALEVAQVLFCPTFPENERTVYCGNLFVGGVPLHESGMRNHPLNPMADSDLVRVLQAQSKRRVTRLGLDEQLPAVPAGTVQSFIADAISNVHLQRIAKLASEHRLLTGGSAIARYWAEELKTDSLRSRMEGNQDSTLALSAGGAGKSARSIVLAGSCSDATRTQVTEFASRFPVLHLEMNHEDPSEVASAALAWCDQHWNAADESPTPLLICSGANAAILAATRERWGEQRAAALVERVFALIARGLVDRGVTRMVIAGGETSGAVINALQIAAVRIGEEISAGVPWVHPIQSPVLSLALKSGNFGGPEFFLEALESAP